MENYDILWKTCINLLSIAFNQFHGGTKSLDYKSIYCTQVRNDHFFSGEGVTMPMIQHLEKLSFIAA